MGIAKGAAKLLLHEASRRPFCGRVLTLGRQDIHFGEETLRAMCAEFGVEVRLAVSDTVPNRAELAKRGFISNERFFESIGFDECKSLDFSEYESAGYIFDMNRLDMPEQLIGRFDVVID